jgi:NitT/TauT family transport system ATP-binding protein
MEQTLDKSRTDEVGVVVDGVSKRFEGGVVALQNASFTAAQGEFVALVGPSGCGKSTLLRMVAGLLPRSEGSILFKNEQITEPRADIGFMFQKPTLLPWKTALQNVLIPAQVKKQEKQDATRRAMEFLSLVGLNGFEHQFPSRLSGGMQQRVALARLLMTGADLMLLDEPFGALDEFTRERLNLELIRIHSELARTTLFVTHNISEAIFLADKVVVMSARPGRVEKVVNVPFPRDRAMEITRTPEFNDMVFGIRSLLGEQV